MNYKLFFYTIYLLVFAPNIFAQVGVNTTSPKSTLHIKTSSTPPDINTPDGLLIPKLSKADLASKASTTYGVRQIGTLIFVTNTDEGSGSSSSQVTEINNIGFYYFSNTNKWLPLIPTSINGLYNNIYTGNDKITNNRIVDQTTNNSQLFFNSTIENAFTVGNNSQLSIDTEHNRVGFGVSNPSVVTEMKTLTIKDGNQKNGRVFTNVALSIAGSGESANNDLLGVGTWMDVKSGNTIVEGAIFPDPAVTSVIIDQSDENRYIPSKIKLNKGKWLLFVGFMSEINTTPSFINTVWIQTQVVVYPNADENDYTNPKYLNSDNLFIKGLTSSYLVSGASSPGIINGRGLRLIKGVVPIEVLVDGTNVGIARNGFYPAGGNNSYYSIIKSGEDYLFAIQIP
jgi:hypothetical protein